MDADEPLCHEQAVKPINHEIVIRDRSSNRIGCIVDNGQQLVARDKFGKNLGYYNKRSNFTLDRNYNPICQGNALASLILKAAGL